MSIKPSLFVLLLGLPLLTACADLGYYLHSVNGHYDIVRQKRDINEILKDEATRNELAKRLKLVQEIRQFAFNELQLPESDSYSEYVDLGRDYALQNLFAAPEFSIRAKQWCYPIVGCAGYRGFFDQQRLDDFVRDLHQQNYDVYVAKVSAYSTLGWFDDPVLNTFLKWPDHYLAGLMFHELAHQQLYVEGDSRFNESFATAVQQAGVEKWLQQKGQYELLKKYQQRLVNRTKVIKLIIKAREELDELYQQQLEESEKRRLKSAMIENLKQQYATLSGSFEVADGFKRWFASDLNNAKLVSVSTYHAWVSVFHQILAQQQGDMTQFYKEVRRISEIPRQQREQCLNKALKDIKNTIAKQLCVV